MSERATKPHVGPTSKMHGTQGGYAAGCGCPACKKAHSDHAMRHELRKIARTPELRHRRRAPIETDALECSCGGLLAEDDNERLFCLRCEPDGPPTGPLTRAHRRVDTTIAHA